jgi:hypothetical protein
VLSAQPELVELKSLEAVFAKHVGHLSNGNNLLRIYSLRRSSARVALLLGSDSRNLAMVPFVHSPCGFKVVYHGYPVAASEVPVSTPLAQSARVYFGGFAPDFPHYISGKEFKKNENLYCL